jgi:putative membrane protein
MSALVVIASIFVALAALIHIVIFLMESVLWSRPQIWSRFGIATQADADTIRPMAYNQGFYNLFLALGAGVGFVMLGASDAYAGGVAISAFTLLSMLLAAVVLVTSQPNLWRAAIVQGAAPLIGLVLLLIALVG